MSNKTEQPNREQVPLETIVSVRTWIVEYKTHWSDGVTDYEQIIHVEAETKEEAIEKGKQKLKEMDESDNRHMDMVWRNFYRCVEEENFRYLSSAKEPPLNGFQGYKDVTKWNGL